VYANVINVRTLVIAAAVAMLLALLGAGIAYANGGDSRGAAHRSRSREG
jgi:hypothetical protein